MTSTINSIWIGKELGPVHAACLRSFARHGYDVVLHCYERPVDLPDGVKLFDANRLMRPDEIVRHKKTSSLALASDIYRYRILREGMGIYVDCDVFCLKPFADADYILSWESNDLVSSAIIKFPVGSPLLEAVLSASENPAFIPPWRSKNRQRFYQLRKALGMPKLVANQSWGTIGPVLITHYVRALKLEERVAPADIYSPLYAPLSNLLFEKGLTLEDLTTSRSVAMHLYNSNLKNRAIEPGTPIYEIVHS